MIETEEVKLALARLPAELASAREQRLKRAMVLSSQYKTVRSATLESPRLPMASSAALI